MAELRWILLAAGILLIVGLWLWERRRPRPAPGADPFELPAGRLEPSFDGDAVDEPAADELPALSVSAADRIGVPAELPVVEIPADARPELARTARIEVPRLDTAARHSAPAPAPEASEPAAAAVHQPARDLSRGERDTWVRTQPIRRAEAFAERRPTSEAADVDASSGATGTRPAATDPASARQRIVALRIMSGHDRWPGTQLIEALHAEGMVFGKYSIFHFQRDDGRAIFSVASMVEPGSFDLDTIDGQSFPGVSLFAVLPGPLDAPSTFDQMLACARRMSDRLGGNLQDENGSTLTAQRVLNLREELVHFDHLLARLRSRHP